MMQNMMQSAKYKIVSLIKRNPAAWSFFWELGTRFDFLLPHERSYFGFKHFARPDGRFLDIGANNGITALGIHKILPAYRVTSIEADMTHQPALERAKARVPNFTYHTIGASDVERVIRLYTPSLDGRPIHALTSMDLDYLKVSVSRDFGEEGARKVVYNEHEIKCVPLDTLGLAPDLVKIDIEGYELPALTGMSATIAKHRPVILLEFTPGSTEKTIAFLSDRDYRYYTFDPIDNSFSIFDQGRETETWSHSALQVNIFCVPAEKVTMIAGKIKA